MCLWNDSFLHKLSLISWGRASLAASSSLLFSSFGKCPPPLLPRDGGCSQSSPTCIAPTPVLSASNSDVILVTSFIRPECCDWMKMLSPLWSVLQVFGIETVTIILSSADSYIMSYFSSAVACAIYIVHVPETGRDDEWVICGRLSASVDKWLIKLTNS